MTLKTYKISFFILWKTFHNIYILFVIFFTEGLKKAVQCFLHVMKSKCPHNIWTCIFFFQTLQEKDDLKSQASPEGKDSSVLSEELQENETAATLLSWAALFECRHNQTGVQTRIRYSSSF